ncbi:MAG: transposase [Lawsonibacter sp.]
MTIFAEVLGLGELQVRDYQIQNNWLLEQLKLSRKKLFGKSTEQADEAVMDQLSFVFNETEAIDAKSVEDAPSESKVKSYIRKRRSGSIEDVIPENLPIDRVEHRLPEEELLCAICGNQMVEIGKEIHRTLKIEHCTASSTRRKRMRRSL